MLSLSRSLCRDAMARVQVADAAAISFAASLSMLPYRPTGATLRISAYASAIADMPMIFALFYRRPTLVRGAQRAMMRRVAPPGDARLPRGNAQRQRRFALQCP